MIALDTNVLIYACDGRDTVKQQCALALVESLTDGAIPWQVAGEFVAASRKLSDQGFTSEAAWARLADFLSLLTLILPTPSLLERARDLHAVRGLSLWDAMLVAACLDAGVSVLYSEDLPGTRIEGLTIANPFADRGP